MIIKLPPPARRKRDKGSLKRYIKHNAYYCSLWKIKPRFNTMLRWSKRMKRRVNKWEGSSLLRAMLISKLNRKCNRQTNRKQ